MPGRPRAQQWRIGKYYTDNKTPTKTVRCARVDRHTDRQADRQADRQKDRQTDRPTDTHTHTHTHTHTGKDERVDEPPAFEETKGGRADDVKADQHKEIVDQPPRCCPDPKKKKFTSRLVASKAADSRFAPRSNPCPSHRTDRYLGRRGVA